MRQRSIQWRLTLWYSLALTAGLSLFALATWFSMRHSLMTDMDAILIEHAQSLQSFADAEIREAKERLPEELDEYSHGFPQDTYVQVKNETGSVVFTSNAAFPWHAGTRANRNSTTVRWRNHPYRLLLSTIRVSGRTWQVAISESLEPIEEILSRLRVLLITLIPAIVVIACLGGLWLSRRALKPVDQVTAAARSIGIANLSERLVVPQTGDELQRLSETWNEMLSRLEDAVKRLSRFTADASHELRTPLALIRTTAEIAARRSRPETQYREALMQIVNESEHMTGLVDDLLLLARCDSETMNMPMSTMNLARVVGEVCSEIRPLADAKDVQFTSCVPEREVMVLGNEPAIRRLVLVLLDNALKYSRMGGQVRVGLYENPDACQLEITDSGPGIAESELSRIFERFYRAPEARASAPSGSGLGLSLAAGIAQHHRARIEVQTVPGEGSTFRVLFRPVAALC